MSSPYCSAAKWPSGKLVRQTEIKVLPKAGPWRMPASPVFKVAHLHNVTPRIYEILLFVVLLQVIMIYISRRMCANK